MTVLLIAYKMGMFDGVELRYSLRSIEKHLHMPDLEVVLVGDPAPSWMTPDLHIPVVPQEDLGKAANISRAVWEASRALRTDGVERAIYMDDDYFLLDPASSVMQVHGGRLDAHVSRCVRNLHRGHWYTQAMGDTYTALVNEMPNLMTFELHRPMPFDIDEAVELLEPIQGQNVFWRTWYGNMSNDGMTAVEGHDGRYVGRSLPAGIPWVSSEDNAWTEWLGKKLSAQFQEPSRWER
ncbi:hypothetical protein PBI_DEWDROP_153 [Microbacterium phage Dewdrop]|nr:hypothetical protein PBI_LEAF_153 [Microbacterium phage Leaf]QGZ17518.1 hypothetical protein PBI_DEWDROP_153 [Microbacterium phage Dewdrop]